MHDVLLMIPARFQDGLDGILIGTIKRKKERKKKKKKVEAYRPLDVIAFESVHLSISCTFSHRPSFASSLFRMLVEGEGRGGKQAPNEENGIWSK